jgi:hypothetical protein
MPIKVPGLKPQASPSVNKANHSEVKTYTPSSLGFCLRCWQRYMLFEQFAM